MRRRKQSWPVAPTVERTDDHRYFYVYGDGRRVEQIGVTRALIAANLVDDAHFREDARARGQLVAKFSEYVLTDTLGGRPIPEEIAGHIVALRKFLDKYAPTVHNAEVILADPNRDLAGTIDVDMSFLGGDTVTDIKSGVPQRWHGLQLAPYAYLLDKAKWMQRGRFGLYLNADGGYRIKEYDDIYDLDYFFRAHELLRWRIRHGTYDRPYGRHEDHGDRPIVFDDGREWRNRDDGDLAEFER